ncbi:MAG: uracil-DNA glycosylase family protein [Phycisphaerales bacterium]|nr:uracil-DNA glycosylase family protein [Phycisphaerales bacterium]
MALPLKVIQQARACTECEPALPLGAKPLVAGTRRSRIVIIGQAPGRLTHEAGVPWEDKSGERLREWLGVTPDEFYNEDLIAMVPMGFCYPGKGSGGDLPPRSECAPLWHKRIFEALKNIEFRIYIGRYAIDAYLDRKRESITNVVQDYQSLLPDSIVLPHPSGRNNIWLKKNEWFEADVIPMLQSHIREIIQ